jgi:glutaredoxin
MASKPKCPYCNKYVEVLDSQKKYKGKTFHSYCYRKLQAEKYSDNLIDIDVKKELCNYIMKLLELEELPVLIQHQIEKYCSMLEINYKDIYDALYYFVEIQENKLNPKYGIGIIPDIIDDSRKFFKELEATHKRLKKQKIYDQDVLVKVKPINYQDHSNVIDISQL